jgi:hypothetical protein
MRRISIATTTNAFFLSLHARIEMKEEAKTIRIRIATKRNLMIEISVIVKKK